jgi:RNA-directed DNA polymerase
MNASPDCDKIRMSFASLRGRADIASLLSLTDKALRYRLYGLRLPDQYKTFELRKKSGGVRTITAPDRPLKSIQRRLHTILQCVYEPKAAVHGFNAGRSIKSNALQHPKSKWILNVDISEFFPSINFGRVRGMFLANPYKCTPEVATVLARICCVNNQLPQGAPTSPIVSNMLCARLDAHMNRLAGSAKCTYTRYADDLTLSTFQNRFPKAIAQLSLVEGETRCVPGPRLIRVIRRNGFKINSSKIRLCNSSQRQEVTGLVVNEKINVPRLFVREIRAMLHNLHKQGIDSCQRDYERKYSQRRHRMSRSPVPPFLWVLRGKIDYLGMIRGKEDEIYRKLLKRLDELAPGTVRVPVLKDEIEELFEHVWVVEVETGTEENRQLSQGSAFILRDTGLITASHVLGKGEIASIRVLSADGAQAYGATLVKRDTTLDIAVLKVDELVGREGLEISKLSPKRNMPIKLLGFPNHNYGDSGYFAEGRISGFRKNPYSTDNWFLISCPIVYGNSGGPILDTSFKVLGVAVRGAPSQKVAHETEFHAAVRIAALSTLG